MIPGTNLKNELDRQALTDWDQERTFYQDALPNLQSTLYSAPDGDFDDKTIAEYEKGFRYAFANFPALAFIVV